MTYRSFQPDRRRRRRRWLLIVLTFIAIIASIAYLVSRETEQRGTVEFFAVADEAAGLHGKAATELESALGAIGVTARQDLLSRFARVQATAAQADALLVVDVPTAVAGSFGQLSTASAAWLAGVTEVERVMTELMNGGSAETATTALGAAFDELRAGDKAYDLFMGSLADPIEGIDIPTFPAVRYVNPEAQDALLYDPLHLVLNVSGSYELAPHHNVSVTGQLDPSPVGDRAGIPIVPFSESISVTAVVTNSGNEAEPSVSVELEIVNADTGDVETLVETIVDLGGGSSSSVMFPDLSITPGSLYQVKLTVRIAVDSRPDDDTWDIRFIRNEAS
jgi:hypothetical protein